MQNLKLHLYQKHDQSMLFETCSKNRSNAPVKPSSFFQWKYVIEWLIALVCIIPVGLVMAVIYFLLRFTSRGPVIFSQSRVGLNGKKFTMYKFRTMVVDAEQDSGPVWSPKDDDRLTTFGRYLRFLHLDELPQIINVLRGEMSLIGPRPERPVFVLYLADEIDGYAERMSVKPGITGFAQIYLDPDVSVDCVRKKIVFDQHYIEAASFWFDVQIMLCTIIRMIGIRGGRGPRWFGLDHRVANMDATPRRRSSSGKNPSRRPMVAQPSNRSARQKVKIAADSSTVFHFSEMDETPSAITPRQPK